ncbi:MAG: cupin domain-containing protein [Prolixibacteraceae bacterium]|nr:cupin domain-containing protein [Prolixibacteraceae bacterium]
MFQNTVLLILLFSGLFLNVNAQNAHIEEKQAFTKKWTIDNCVNQFNADGVVPTRVGYQYWFADKNFLDGQTLKLSVVKPYSATHAPHTHAEDEFFFILEGKARFYLAGDSVDAMPYASFYCPSGVEHGIRNAGDTELKYLVIKKYNLQKEK